MALVKLILFVSFCCVVSAASVSNNATDQGYLVVDFGIKPSCYKMPKNQICPASFNHPVVGATSNLDLVMLGLRGAELNVKQVDRLKGTQACRQAVREYSCSNTLMTCKPSNLTIYGVKLDFNVSRTTKACAKVQKLCRPDIQAQTIHNCSVIQNDPMEFAECAKHENVDGDICPNSNFMHSKAITKFYEVFVNAFKSQLPNLRPFLKDSSCAQEVMGVYCQLLRGAMCSNDRTLRVYALSQQDCAATLNKCVTNQLVKMHMLGSCSLLPDKTTAKKAALPTPIVSVSKSNKAANSG